MPEVTVNIYSRTYRLAVSTGEEALIERCADLVDRQMKAIREGGKVINQDQIAVLAALEVAYEAHKNTEKQVADSLRTQQDKDAEIEALNARIRELEARPVAEPTLIDAPSADAQLLREIEKLSKQCEEAIFTDMRKGRGMF